MYSESYEFKVGKFDCVVLKDAVHAYENPARFLFYNAPQGRLLNQVVDRKPLVHSFHFPYPGLGNISGNKEAYRWRQLTVEDNG